MGAGAPPAPPGRGAGGAAGRRVCAGASASLLGLLATTKPLQHPLDGTAVWAVSAVPLVAMFTAAAVAAEWVECGGANVDGDGARLL
jgi:hypothetical protein